MPEQKKSQRPDWAQPSEPSQEERGVAVQTIQPRELSLMEAGGFDIRRLDDAWRLAEAAVRGGMAPAKMTTGGVVAVWQAGAEMEITPMRALAQLHHIGGKIGMMVEELGAHCRKRGAFAKGGRPKIRWELDGEPVDGPPKTVDPKEWPDGLTAIAYAKAATDPEDVLERSFSVLEARRARLWLKRGAQGDSAWITYPGRMLGRRALGFLLRDEFAEYLGPARPYEELRDVEEQGPRDDGLSGPPQPATTETDDPLFEKAVADGEEIEDAQVVTGEGASPTPATPIPGSPEPLSPTPPETAEEAVKPEPPSPPTSDRKMVAMTCVNCGARDEYPEDHPEGRMACTDSDPQNPHDVRVKKFAPTTPPASKGPAVPAGPKPKEPKKTNINRKELVTMLAVGDHPIPLEVVKEWSAEQVHHAHAWIQEEIVAMDAEEAGLTYTRRDLPRPSFIPAYGDPRERARLNFPDPGLPDSEAEAIRKAEEEKELEQGALIHPFPDNPCMFAFDDGGACRHAAGHQGEHEPL